MLSVQVDAEPSRPDLFKVSNPAVSVLTALFPSGQELVGLCRETCHRGSTLNSTRALKSLGLMGSSGPAWVLHGVGTLRGKSKKRDPAEEGKETERLAGTHWGLSRGHSGSAGSSSPIEEGKQILITSSTSHTKGPRNARAGGLAEKTTQASTTNEPPPPYWGLSVARLSRHPHSV